MNKEDIEQFQLETRELLKNVMDPEVEINIVDMSKVG